MTEFRAIDFQLFYFVSKSDNHEANYIRFNPYKYERFRVTLFTFMCICEVRAKRASTDCNILCSMDFSEGRKCFDICSQVV